MVSDLTSGLLLGLFAVHLLMTYHAYRLRDDDTGTDPAGRSADLVDTEDRLVECPDCGADNELGYRYCRACVTELPAAISFERYTDGPLGRFAR